MSLPQELRHALSAFTSVAIDHIKNPNHTHETPTERALWVPTLESTNIWSFAEQTYPWWWNLLANSLMSLSKSAEYQLCEHLMQTTEAVARHLDKLIVIGSTGQRFDVPNCLLKFVAYQLKDMKIPVFETGQFEHTFRDFEEFIANDVVDFEGWIPLEHLSCQHLPIQFTSLVRLMDSLVVTDCAGKQKKVRGNPVVYCEWQEAKLMNCDPTTRSLTEKKTIGSQIVMSLHLLKEGRVRADGIFARPKRWTPIWSNFIVKSPGVWTPAPPLYEFREEEVNEVQIIRQQLVTLNEQLFKSLALALRRYEIAQKRVDPGDRLIDQMIAFEALYLADEGGTEKAFRLALRTAFLLERGEVRKVVYETMKQAYSIRSSIVHGADPKLPKGAGVQMSLSDFSKLTEDYLRRSLRRFLDLAQRPKARNPLVNWDDLLFPNSSGEAYNLAE